MKKIDEHGGVSTKLSSIKDHLERLVKMKGKGREFYRVALYALAKHSFDKPKHVALEKFVRDLGMKKGNVSRTLKVLDKLDIWDCSGAGSERKRQLRLSVRKATKLSEEEEDAFFD